jgi:hypothetical protein
MNTMSAASAAATGARHLRMGRNGQDAAATWVGGGAGAGAIVVCDGCGSGASSEVGARLGAQLVIAALMARLAGGMRAGDPALWAGMRSEVGGVLGRVAEAMPGDRARAVHDHFLFTIVAAVATADEVAVWALGDGAYAIGDRQRVLGPFADNQPPYLGYDLLGTPQLAELEVASARCGSVVVATDGVAEVGLDAIAVDRALRHPDALRRQLVLLARNTERIDWAAQRIVREPAMLQDDGAVAVLRWS